MRQFILSIMLISALAAHAQQKCDMPDSTYWACAGSGRLYHVCAESTITVQTAAKNFIFTAIHFETTQGKYGWAGANDSFGNVLIMRTIDSGKSWLITMMPILPKGDAVERIQLVKNLFVFVLLKSGTILRSHDWGCTYIKASPVPLEGNSYEQGKKLFEEFIRYFEGNTK